MRRFVVSLALLSAAAPALAGRCVTCDPANTVVAHRVVADDDSCHTPSCSNTCVPNPDLSALENVPRQYWKCSPAGTPYTSVVEMTQAEKNAVDAASVPDPQPLLPVESPAGVRAGLQARESDARVGSATNHNFFLMRDRVSTLGLIGGGRVSVGNSAVGPTAEDRLIVDGPIRLTDGGTRPTCDATRRGMLWVEFGSGAVGDSVDCCLRLAGGGFSWLPVAP